MKAIIMFLLCILCNIDETNSKYVISENYDVSTELAIDKTAPQITVTDKNLDKVQNTAIEEAVIIYSDEMSGVKSAVWKYNSSSNNFDNVSSKDLKSNTTFNQSGWYKIEVIDNALNKSEKVFYLDFAVCKIGEKYYRKLEDAIKTASKDKTTIVMLKDVKENANIAKSKNIILDLNNKKIEGYFNIEKEAYIEVKNGSINNSSQSKPLFTNYGELKITNGTYDSSLTDVIEMNEGIVKIDGGTMTASSGNVVSLNNGKITLNDGTLKSTGTGEIVHIKSGEFIMNKGALINTGSNAGIYIESGKANLNGGKITHAETSACDVIALQSEAVLNIDGVVIENNTKSKEEWACISSGGKVKISSGEIKNTSYGRAIYSYGGSLEIIGGSISNVTTYYTSCVDSFGKFSMSGGSIKSLCDICALMTYNEANIYSGTIRNEGKGEALRVKSGICKISGGSFYSKENYAIYKESGECSVSNAVISGKTSY